MTDNFVGFARSPKQSKTASRESISTAFTLAISLPEAVQLISTAEGVQRWIGELVTPVAKWRFQLGAKLTFKDEQGEFGATFGAINLPGEVIFLTERFGEITIKFGVADRRRTLFRKKSASNEPVNRMEFEVARMCEPDEIEAWDDAAHALITRLANIVDPQPPVIYTADDE